MSERLTALFVRVPESLAAELAARSRAQGRSKQAVVTELLSGGVDQAAADSAVILDLDETASLLGVSPADILERIGDGSFPARRFGSAWRCSRAAVLTWMAGTDPTADHPTGF
jgi:excisionase family DNA binding protein